MSWFKKKLPEVTPRTESEVRNAIEIVTHKNARKEVIQEAKEAQAKLQKLFDENGFTVKIVLAMGAKQRRANHHGH